MDTMRSSEFRKRYAALAMPTEVTANGHVIGVWMPRAAADEVDRWLNVPSHMRPERDPVIEPASMSKAWAHSQPVPKVRK